MTMCILLMLSMVVSTVQMGEGYQYGPSTITSSSPPPPQNHYCFSLQFGTLRTDIGVDCYCAVVCVASSKVRRTETVCFAVLVVALHY